MKVKYKTYKIITLLLSLAFILALAYVYFFTQDITKSQISCLKEIGKTKCPEFINVVIVPDKVSEIGYMCGLDNLENYKRFSINEINSCGIR